VNILPLHSSFPEYIYFIAVSASAAYILYIASLQHAVSNIGESTQEISFFVQQQVCWLLHRYTSIAHVCAHCCCISASISPYIPSSGTSTRSMHCFASLRQRRQKYGRVTSSSSGTGIRIYVRYRGTCSTTCMRCLSLHGASLSIF
jgi:hypothetical protein